MGDCTQEEEEDEIAACNKCALGVHFFVLYVFR